MTTTSTTVAPRPRGYLVLTVEEASGKTQKGQFTWETTTSQLFEAFVKGGVL